MFSQRSFHTFQNGKNLSFECGHSKCTFSLCGRVTLFYFARSPMHMPHWMVILVLFHDFYETKKTINVEDAAILEHLLKPKGCKTFTFHPMMINTLGKVPVYSFDVCDHIPSWCTSPFYLVYGAAWETYGQRKASGKNRKISPCPIKTAPLSCLLEAKRFSPYSNKSFLLESHRTHNFTWTLPAGFMSQNDIFQKQWDCTVHMQPIKVHWCFCWI